MSVTFHLGSYQSRFQDLLSDLMAQHVVQRLWKKDHTLWKPTPGEITNRLGWLDIAERLYPKAEDLKEWAASLVQSGFRQVLLLGMGGSSLAAETLWKVFGPQTHGLAFTMLDSTDPEAVLSVANRIDPERTLLIVATKSGGTIETRSFLTYFYHRLQNQLGTPWVGDRFVAITDPGSDVEALGARLGFRRVFLNEPEIGGRYSALSYFGMVPAALMGLDVGRLLDSGIRMMDHCHQPDNEAAQVGGLLGYLALMGRDKATFFFSHPLEALGDWIEQLIAESTGKENRTGILPVVGESIASPDRYGDDRVFIRVALAGDPSDNLLWEALKRAGHPVVEIQINGPEELGGQFFFWEFATAVACERLRVNPFDQPHVQLAKVIAKEKIDAYQEDRKIPKGPAFLPDPMPLNDFLYQARPGDYIAIQAFVPPTPETDASLSRLRVYLRDQMKLAVTVGYGPRFLHSTGQLHKGDSGKGLFIQLVSDPPEEDPPVPIDPEKGEADFTFGILKLAQALGDYEALLNANRRVIRFDLGRDVLGGIARLMGT